MIGLTLDDWLDEALKFEVGKASVQQETIYLTVGATIPTLEKTKYKRYVIRLASPPAFVWTDATLSKNGIN